MDSENNLDLLKKEIQQELLNAVNNSKLVNLFQKYGLTEDGLVKFQCILDITKIQLSDAVVAQQLKESLPAIREKELIIPACNCWCENPPGFCCQC
ncbi:hypothetical protein SAMD00079811_46770 [Scytonema sp. HK-05]|uniref:hypothetical protein n=1 Tax=Scytonema sp. HK-05 TaxID=1137095 RepID=UPI000936C721|nr:hypothetical protein [Scytonema sp. HK-05]OKH58974.1 hypothetical protein NIES2130_11720 [Scytonema sp. HK-05]BAY47061.1 hypothetical protein SAMD00079811_46770 [Scytonema sp. HK-05]